MSDRVLSKLNRLIDEAQKLKVAYTEGRILDVLDRFEFLTELIEGVEPVIMELSEEPIPDFDWEAFSKRPPKNPELALKTKIFLKTDKKSLTNDK